MRLRLIIPIILIAICQVLSAQSMIGLTKKEVQERVMEDFREFRKDNMVVRQQFNYLKYVNRNRTRTWILYFTDKDICKTSKLVCDYSEYNKVLDDLSFLYARVGDSKWEYRQGRETFEVVLTREEWYFTVRETRKE